MSDDVFRRRTPAALRRAVRHRVPAAAVAAGVAGLLVALAACSDEEPPSGSPIETPTVSVSETPSIVLPAHPLVLVQPTKTDGKPTFDQIGSADTTVSVATLDGGTVDVGTSDGGPAMRFPAYTNATTYPRAVVLVHNKGSHDQFDPGEGDFTLGVDFNLDAATTGREDDNGNNMIQRGLSSDPSLYKLEVDASMRPDCTVRGTQGTIILRSTVRTLPGVWYRVSCARRGDQLSISVGRVLSDGTVIPVEKVMKDPIGVVSAADPSIPISIGGKVSHDGSIVASASDQFNGSLRNPFLLIPR